MFAFAQNEEEYILTEARTRAAADVGSSALSVDGVDNDGNGLEEQGEDDAVLRRKAANRAAKLDRRHLFQGSDDELTRECREWLNRTEEEHLSTYYCGNVMPEKDGTVSLEKLCPIPPSLPGCGKRDSRNNISSKYHDLFFAPPVALSDSVRAADPIDRNYMISEDFAILIWFVRTIPYCGSEVPKRTREDGHIPPLHDKVVPPPSIRKGGQHGPFRWNWARTHGVCLRSIGSISERWRKYVIDIYLGLKELPAGTFRRFAAQTGFFWFANDEIVGFKIGAIKEANENCRLSRDAPEDPFCIISESDRQFDRQMEAYLEERFGDKLHDGHLFAELTEDV